jgi:hypothetical protein
MGSLIPSIVIGAESVVLSSIVALIVIVRFSVAVYVS